MINKDDFLSWRDHPVTVAFFEALLDEADNLISSLTANAGLEPLRDRYLCGSIATVRWLADWQPKFIETKIEEETDDEY